MHFITLSGDTADTSNQNHTEYDEDGLLTDGEDGAEDGGVLHGGAVPPVVAELPLALPDTCTPRVTCHVSCVTRLTVPGPAAHVDHVVSVEHAELLLTLRQALDPGTVKYLGCRKTEILICIEIKN